MHIASAAPSLSSLVIVGNGPGEISGWAVPVAAEARRLARERARSIEIGLCLPPCQFASGQEEAAAAAAGVFDHITNPRTTLRLGLGLRGWTPAGRPVILHVGGDLWFSRRLARRWHGRAYAFVERARVARAHRAYERIFVPTAALRDTLLSRGVPTDKVITTGDPLYDAVLAHPPNGPAPRAADTRPLVTFLAGSRDVIFRAVFPFWVQTAAALRERLPHARLCTVISPFVTPAVHQALIARHRQALEDAGVEIGYGGWQQFARADLVVTIPGTNTMELAIMRIPSLVILPLSLAPQVPAEGLVEWITRIPYLGPAMKGFLARRYVQRRPYLALPSIRAGRQVMPELAGLLTPQQVAMESARLIEDGQARAAMAEALTALPRETGASRRILEAMQPIWGGA